MLSIVIPAHNEEKRIGKTLEVYGKFFSYLKKQKEIDEFEKIVIANACSDNTTGVVREMQKKFGEIKLLNFKEGGKGFAVTEGFKESLKGKADLIGFVDADMATPPEAFYDLIKNLGEYDGIIASRGLKDSIVKTSFLRKLTNRGFNFFVRSLLFLPYKDTQCGAKLFKREVLEKIIDEIGMTKWAFDVDLLYQIKKKGFKIKELPTKWEDKAGSKINLVKVPFQMFSAIMRLRLMYSPFNFIVRLYNKLPEKLKIHNL